MSPEENTLNKKFKEQLGNLDKKDQPRLIEWLANEGWSLEEMRMLSLDSIQYHENGDMSVCQYRDQKLIKAHLEKECSYDDGIIESLMRLALKAQRGNGKLLDITPDLFDLLLRKGLNVAFDILPEHNKRLEKRICYLEAKIYKEINEVEEKLRKLEGKNNEKDQQKPQ